MSEMRKGSCLCGAVKIELPRETTKLGVCHCAMCRKLSGGGALLALHGDSELRATGTEHIGRYKSSDWAERGFCKKCGTPLFYHLTVGSMEHFYSSGLFDGDNEGFKITEEIFIDQKPDHIPFLDENSKRKTAAEVFDEVNG